MSDGAGWPERHPARLAAAVGLIVLGLCLVTVRGALGGGMDEEIVFLTTASLAIQGDLAFDTAELSEVRARVDDWRQAVRRAGDGRWYQVFGPGQSLAAVPLYRLGQRVAAGQADEVRRATLVRWVTALNPLVVALTSALLCGWLLSLGYPRGVGLFGGLAYGLATFAWPYAKTFLSEPLSALTIVAAAFWLWWCRARGGIGWAVAAGAALGFGILVRPHNVVVAPFLFALAWLPSAPDEHRSPLEAPWPQRPVWLDALLFALPPLLAVGWWLWFNAARHGSPLDFGYLPEVQGDFALGNLWPGLVGQMLSPGRGLIWYAPPVVLAWCGWPRLRDEHRLLAKALLAAVLAQWLFYSLRTHWWGNWCWGPRYLLPVLPLIMMIAAPGLAESRGCRIAAAGLALLGGVNALAGLVVYNGLYQDWVYALPDGLAKMLWEPEYSPLIGHWRFAVPRYLDLMLYQMARIDPALALAAGLLRGWPALAGLWLLWPRRRPVGDGASS